MNRSEQNSHRGRSLCFISHKNHSCVLPPQYCCFYRLQDGSIDGVTDQPVVSLSLGNACDFLIEDDDAFFDDDDGGGDSSSGGRARALVPLSVRLESGDVILFGGPARRCKHSVARIFPDTCPAPLLENSKKTSFPLSMSLGGSARSYVFSRVGALSAVLSFALVSSRRCVRKSTQHGPKIGPKSGSGRPQRSRKSGR